VIPHYFLSSLILHAYLKKLTTMIAIRLDAYFMNCQDAIKIDQRIFQKLTYQNLQQRVKFRY